MASVNKWELLLAAYAGGASLTEVARDYGVSVSTARHHVLKAGLLRSRTDGVRIAAANGKIGFGLRGRSRVFSPTHCENIRAARLSWGENNAAGVSVKPSGYAEYTRGPHKGRSVHVVKMEDRLGRRLLDDEHVHHIDGDKLNNDENNLALITRSGHLRLHRREQRLKAKGQ